MNNEEDYVRVGRDFVTQVITAMLLILQQEFLKLKGILHKRVILPQAQISGQQVLIRRF